MQNLNGYDSPWPAGGGKNKLNKDTQHIGAYLDASGVPQSSTQWSYSEPIETGANQAVAISGYGVAGTAPRSCWYDENQNFISSFQLAATSPTIVTSPATAKYLRVSIQPQDLNTAQVELGSSATSYAPYSNECPISGWTGVNVWDDPYYAGLIEWNQLCVNDETKWISYIAGSTLTYDESNRTATLIVAADGSTSCRGRYKFTSTDQHKYFISCVATPSVNGEIWVELSRGWGRLRQLDAVANTSYTIEGVVNANGATDLTNCVQFFINGQLGYTLTVKDMQIFDLTTMFGAGNEPTVEAFKALFPHDYYPYNAGTETLVGTVNGMDTRSISITLGSTVYSGTVDVCTGVGEIDKVAVPLTGDMFNNYSSGLTAIYGPETAYPYEWAKRYLGSAVMCSDGTAESRLSFPNVANGFFCGDTQGGNQGAIFLKLNGITTSLANGKAFLDERYNGGNPVTVCYELATPIPIQLTPQEVESLAGDNTMWTDAQNLEVTYRQN